jgi:hypothetical protein
MQKLVHAAQMAARMVACRRADVLWVWARDQLADAHSAQHHFGYARWLRYDRNGREGDGPREKRTPRILIIKQPRLRPAPKKKAVLMLNDEFPMMEGPEQIDAEVINISESEHENEEYQNNRIFSHQRLPVSDATRRLIRRIAGTHVIQYLAQVGWRKLSEVSIRKPPEKKKAIARLWVLGRDEVHDWLPKQQDWKVVGMPYLRM